MRYFEEISQIPRPTFHEDKIADYLCTFAKERGLEYYRDAVHNVLIKLEGTEGRKNEPAILLQGHTDMVCEKNDGVKHDFLLDGIKLIEKDGWIKADGTTLGADNGVAVATMLYILDGADGHIVEHPPIECLFTVSEEVGMIGVYEFDYSKISARKMINMDSADESLIIAGCAGGQRSTLILGTELEDSVGNALKISVKGLAGGHSGEDVHKGRANSNKLMGRILLSISKKVKFKLVSINGGNKDNAIPRETSAVIVTQNEKDFIAELKKLESAIKEELCHDDVNFAMTVEPCTAPEKVLTDDIAGKAIFLLAAVQNGIFEMNRDIKDIVEFSRNIGVVKTSDDGREIRFTFSARSPKPTQLNASNEQLSAFADMLGMKVEYGISYPGWTYVQNSEIREAYVENYRGLYGKDPEITVIHAGLECGLIKEKLPDMDIISCGPIVVDLHSPDEALHIASFERFFTVIKNVLQK